MTEADGRFCSLCDHNKKKKKKKDRKTRSRLTSLWNGSGEWGKEGGRALGKHKIDPQKCARDAMNICTLSASRGQVSECQYRHPRTARDLYFLVFTNHT